MSRKQRPRGRGKWTEAEDIGRGAEAGDRGRNQRQGIKGRGTEAWD